MKCATHSQDIGGVGTFYCGRRFHSTSQMLCAEMQVSDQVYSGFTFLQSHHHILLRSFAIPLSISPHEGLKTQWRFPGEIISPMIAYARVPSYLYKGHHLATVL